MASDLGAHVGCLGVDMASEGSGMHDLSRSIEEP